MWMTARILTPKLNFLQRLNRLYSTRYTDKYLSEISVVLHDKGDSYVLQRNRRNLTIPTTGLEMQFPTKSLAALFLQELKPKPLNSNSRESELIPLMYRAMTLQQVDSGNLVQEAINQLIAYIHTDSIWYVDYKYRAFSLTSYLDGQEKIAAEQRICWKPIIDAVNNSLNLAKDPIRFVEAKEGLFAMRQSDFAVEMIHNHLRSLHPIALAAVEHVTRITKSILLGSVMTLDHSNHFSTDQLTKAACLEVLLQCNTWGHLEDHHSIHQSQLRNSIALGRLLLSAVDNKCC